MIDYLKKLLSKTGKSVYFKNDKKIFQT